MRNIVIYYIATDIYTQFIDGFIKSLCYFCETDKLTIILLSDSSEDYSKYNNEHITIKQYYIQHFCWPIITLFKMKYILDFFIEDCDYAFYMNSNLRWIKNKVICLDKDLLFSTKRYSSDELYKGYNIYQIPNSTSFIDYNKLPENICYCQGGLFGGKPKPLKSFCADIYEMIKVDLQKGIIPIWHDESYLNKWMYDHYWALTNKPNIELISLSDNAIIEYKGKYIDKEFKHLY